MAEDFERYRSDDDGAFIDIRFNNIIPENHPARYIKEFIDTIDVSSFEEKYKVGKSQKGRAPKDVRMMLCVILYAIYSRIYSARKIDYATYNYSDFWFFTHKNRISHDKISKFIILHGENIANVFLATISLAEKNNLLSFENLYHDGFLMKANASKKKNYTKKRLEKKEEKIRSSLSEILSQIETDVDGVVPKEAIRLKKELKKIEELKKELNDKINIYSQKDCPSEKEKREKNTQINSTDKDAELMRQKDNSYANSYLKTTALDSKADILVSSCISGHYDEPHHLPKLIKEANKNCEGMGEYNKSFADSGFITHGNAVQTEAMGIELIGPTKQHENDVRNPEKTKGKITFNYNESKNCVSCSEGKTLHYFEKYHDPKKGTIISSYRNIEACKSCSKRKNCTKSEYREVKIDSRLPAQMRCLDRYKSEEGQELYKKRSHCAETFQGDLKQNGKFIQLFRRGNEKVQVDSIMHDIIWNLRRIFNSVEKEVVFG